jgi:L-phenylalanine/L-methionine N-acetyltransferase
VSRPTIRLIETKDFPQLCELYSERLAYSNTLQLPYQSAEQWQRVLTTQGHTSLVAVQEEELLGHTGIDLAQRLRRRHVASIGVGVKAAARGQGVGTALIRAAVEICERWTNISRIELEVYTDNIAAIALYKKCGFVVEGTCRQYAYRDGGYADVLVMARIKEDAVPKKPESA